ncbi:MAG: LLM class flavin-dependent oxidoreductase [Nitrososphaerota archaeon]|nr:LLM class flavin-dependent oxidoreductase [Nitrososphaerota archaeon]
MRFGLALESFTPPGKALRPDSILKMASLAESLGFSSVWVWDHLLLGSRKVFPVLDSLTTLAAIGARTGKIRLGTSVLIIALRNPVVLAKVASTIQMLSDGRLILGTAAGWYEREFRAAGVDFHHRGRIFEERFKLLRSLLNESDVNYSQEGLVFEHATIEPKHEKKIPLLVGGYSDSVLNRAGRISDGWISYYYAPQDFRDSFAKVISSAENSNRDSSALRSVDVVPLAVADSFEAGDSVARAFTNQYMDLPKNTRCTVESSVRGTIRECIEQIKKFEAAGVKDLVFIPANYDLSQVEIAGKEILPAFLK